MLLQNDFLTVKIGKLTFTSNMGTKPYYTLDPDAVIGWTDGVNVRRDTTARPTGWGDFPERGYKSSRMITLTGLAVANTSAELHKMRDDFMGILNHGGYEEIQITNSYGSRYASVALEGPNNWIQQLDNVATWKMDLYAPDPRLYGVQKTSQLTDSTMSGGVKLPIEYPIKFYTPPAAMAVVVENNGNADAWPKFVVTGDFFSGFEISNNNSKTVRFEGIVTMTAPVTIDMARGTAIQNGVDKSSQITKRDWFAIPPRSSLQPMFLPIQDAFGWCDILYRDTWI